MKTITIWSDFACPFCYLGETMLENVLKETGTEAEIIIRAYELSAEAPATPAETMTQHFQTSHGITEAEAESQMARITKMAARAGLEYNLEGVKVCNTLDAHRLMKLAYDTADGQTALRLNFALFHANFVENRLLSDHAVLREIAVKSGLEAEAVDRILASDIYTDLVRTDEKLADSLGLEYIPYMRFSDGKILQGVLSTGAIRHALTD